MTGAGKATRIETILAGGGEMGAAIRAFDWSKHPLGAIETWPQSLRTAVSICLNSRFPMVIWWSQDLFLLYNDAWRPILGSKHPKALGRPGSEMWPENWDIIGAQLNSVLATGTATWSDDLMLPTNRSGYLEEAYYTYSYSPIFLETGEVAGVFTAVADTTQRVLGERRLATLRDLAAQAGRTFTVEEACETAIQTIGQNPADIPFALLYLIDGDSDRAVLQAKTLSEASAIAHPASINLTNDNNAWSLSAVAQSGQATIVENLARQFGEIAVCSLKLSLQQALVLPIRAAGQDIVVGMLVVGINPGRALDEDYRNFFEMTTGHIATAIANARTYEAERQRAEALAEIDRAKTIFFSNVSHEFRTPLTLMLGPTEDALTDPDAPLAPQQRERIELVQRNGLRLLKLVNTLLDFSRIEAGRIQATYEPTDLAAFTAELASTFRSTIERAGLRLIVDCPPLPESAYIDREMWEKIVLNLLSNAFKFTFVGEIEVKLQIADFKKLQIEENVQSNVSLESPSTINHQPSTKFIQLKVRDTGTGIPAAELPQLFERFHRVKGAIGRSFEGSGIGLSLVQELVKLHDGTVSVTSVEGQGSCFTVSIPTGFAHLPQDRISASRTLESTASGAASYVEEALRWLPEEGTREQGLSIRESGLRNDQSPTINHQLYSLIQNSPTPRILLADDNTDMRDYVKRLLSQRYEVEAVADGLAALAAMSQQRPDLVLTDVMMPGIDGFELLRELRNNPETREIPIVLLSARAGEESRVEGLEAGADDYLIKPFSARELLARVEANLKMAQLRQEAARREQLLRLEAETVRENLAAILSSISDGFFVLDRRWCYTYINDRVTETFDMAKEDVLGKNIWELFPDAIGTEVYVQFHRAMTEQKPVDFEYFYPKWNRWFENRVYPAKDGITVFYQDITDSKQAQKIIAQAREVETRLIASLQERAIELEEVNQQLEIALEELEVSQEELRVQNDQLIDARRVAEERWQRYQDLFNFAPDAYIVTDARCMIQEVNQATLSLLFSNREELIGKALIIYISQNDRHFFLDKLNQLNQLGTLSQIGMFELSLKHRNGKSFPAAITVTGVNNPQGRLVGFRWLIRDISDRKRAEVAAQLLAEASSVLVSSLDYQTMLANIAALVVPTIADYCFFDVITADGMLQRVAWRHGNPEKQAWFDGIQRYLPPRDLAAHPVGGVLESGKAKLVSAVTDDWMQTAASSDEHLQFMRDCELRSLITVPLIARNRKLGILTLCATATSHRQYTHADLVLAEELAYRAALALDNAQLYYQAQEANRIKDEFLAVLSHELRSPLNPILGWTNLLRSRPMDAATTQRALETIERNAKLQTQLIEDLLDISRILRGKLVLNTAPVNLESTIKAAMETVRLAAEAKAIDFKFQIQNLKLQIENTSDSFNLSSEISNLKFLVSGDSNRLQQVFWNLFSNGIKFTPNGGKVEVRLSAVMEEEKSYELENSLIQNSVRAGLSAIAVGTQQKLKNPPLQTQNSFKPYAQITVTDTGKGINPDFLPYVFDSFRQEDSKTTRKFGGLGLGLAIVRHIAELHGGTVKVESPGEGKGATFTVKLPLMATALETTRNEGISNGNPSLNGVKVLIVDDEADAREMLAFMLEDCEAEVTAVASANEAFAVLPQLKPDVLVSDIGMPDVDGYMLMRQVRSLPADRGGEIPAIAVTAYAGEYDRQQALAAGFQWHISKPVEPQILLQAITTLIKK